jgi:hypothetical protein
VKKAVLPKYRKFYSSLWTDFKFAQLDKDSKLAWIYIFTHPNMTALGAMRYSMAGIAEEIGVKINKVERLRDDFLIVYCPTTATIRIPNFIEHQDPQSPNCVTSWGKSLPYIPDGPAKDECVAEAMFYVMKMTEAFRKAFAKALRKDFDNDLTKAFIEAYDKA